MTIRVEIKSLADGESSLYEINTQKAAKMVEENPKLDVVGELVKVIKLDLQKRLEEDLELGR